MKSVYYLSRAVGIYVVSTKVQWRKRSWRGSRVSAFPNKIVHQSKTDMSLCPAIEILSCCWSQTRFLRQPLREIVERQARQLIRQDVSDVEWSHWHRLQTLNSDWLATSGNEGVPNFASEGNHSGEELSLLHTYRQSIALN